MEFGSEEMIFTCDELQYIANGLAYLQAMSNNKLEDFTKIFNLLNRINEQIDKIDCMQGVC